MASTSNDDSGWYNGYSWKERLTKLKESQRREKLGLNEPAQGPCAICCDPNVPVEFHSEDYSIPYRWTPPAEFALCVKCHRHKLHKRFNQPIPWKHYLTHVRRGGYAHEWNSSARKEVRVFFDAVERGEAANIRQIRPYTKTIGEEWFATLRMDKESLRDPSARPRP